MRTIALALSVLALAAAGCGGDDKDTADTTPAPAAPAETATPEPDGGGSTVTVAADPSGALAYEQTTLQAKAGKVTIDFANNSQVPHDVVVQQGDEDLGATDQITGSTTKTTVDLKAGTYTFYCSVPGHLAAGMKGTLTVE